MSKDNRDFFKEKKDWSEIKDTLLGAYLKPYFQKVLMTKRPIFYVDCFSGKGRFDDGKPGSPIIALDIRKDCIAQTRSENAQIDMCFIDLNYASDLELNLSSYSSCYWKPAIFSGKYEKKIIEILKTKKNVNVFLYIDPYGIQALDSELFDIFSTFEFASFEMLINFNSFGFFREACRALKVDYTKDRALTDLEDLVEYSPIQVEADQKSINLLNKIADGTYWQEIVRDFNMGKFDGYQAEGLLSAGYKKQLRKRYSYVLDMPIQIKKTNHPKYRMIHVCNHEEGCLLMAQNMLNRTDELVLNIQGEGQMSIFDLMSDVSTDSSGKQITIQDVKGKMKEHLLNYNTGVHLSRLTAEFYVKYGLIGYISMVNDALKELEKDGYIQIVRQPQFSEKTNKPLKFMDEKGNHNVIIRRLQP